jgi:hypothetical protein
MKLFSVVSTALLLFVLGASVSIFAQEQRDDTHPQAQEEEKRDDAHARQDDAHARQEEDRNVKHDQEVKRDDRHEEAHGGRIPDDKFRAHFGAAHHFRIGHPTIVGGQPRFNYGGYWFVIAQPWPAGWSYNDEVYVDFIDGAYYLIDPVHPGPRLVINVVL